MTDDREPFEQARAAGLAKRHETRLAHAQVVMATDIPMQSGEENPFRALVTALALSSNDWGSARDFAWIYGIVCGWSDEDDDAWPEQQRKWGWTDEQVTRLKALHVKFHAAAWETLPPTEAETKALAETATEVGRRLGRKEAVDDIVMAFLEFEASDIRGRADINIDRAIAMVREIAKGTSMTTLTEALGTDPYLGWDLT